MSWKGFGSADRYIVFIVSLSAEPIARHTLYMSYLCDLLSLFWKESFDQNENPAIHWNYIFIVCRIGTDINQKFEDFTLEAKDFKNENLGKNKIFAYCKKCNTKVKLT